MRRYNPFRPGKIVDRELFTGRVRELASLEKALSQTAFGNAHHFLVHGERGIGKSSLLHYFEAIASGNRPSAGGHSYNFFTLEIELEEDSSYLGILRKIARELGRKVDEHQKLKNLAKDAWGFLQKWEVLGVKYTGGAAPSPPELTEELALMLAKSYQVFKTEFDGILLLIDEAEKPLPSAGLGKIVKSLTERLTKLHCENVAIGISGQSSVIDALRNSHKSAPRIFEVVELNPLSFNECLQLIHRGLRQLSQKRGFHVSITDDAADMIADYSGGYPHFVQEFAYWSLEASEKSPGRLIDAVDVRAGLQAKSNGAFRQIGQKYFDQIYLEDILDSDERKAILRAVAFGSGGGWIGRSEICSEIGIDEAGFERGAVPLEERGVLVAKDDSRRLYKFPSKSFSVWINAYIRLEDI